MTHLRILLLSALSLLPHVATAQLVLLDLASTDSRQTLLPPLEEAENESAQPAPTLFETRQATGERPLPKDEDRSAPTPRQAAPEPAPKVVAPRPLPAHLMRLRSKVLRALSYQMSKPVSTARHSPWGIMHSMHSFGVETKIHNGSQNVNAAGWLCWNKPCRGTTLMYTNSSGELRLRIGPGFQGHEGQFLALLGQSRVPSDFELKVGEHTFTVEDLVEHEKTTCKPGTELTFKLIGLSHYLGAEATWSNRYGTWTIPRLIEEELRQPVVGAACGGTHRLMGHTYALARARKAGVPIQGAWKRANSYTLSYQRRAMMLRNRDGSFSTKWFEGRGMAKEIDRRLQTSGHILEWLVVALPEDDLRSSKIVRSVDYLATLMLNNRGHEWEIGPKGHAVRALALYDQKVFGGQPGKLNQRLATLVRGHKAR